MRGDAAARGLAAAVSVCPYRTVTDRAPFTLRAFVRESNRIEGIHRPPTVREMRAHEEFLALSALAVPHVCAFVRAICGAPLREEPGMNVVVGRHRPPPGGPAIRDALRALLAEVSERRLWSYEAHVRYETLHPFMDGNGRSGRAIWLWMRRGEAPIGFLHQWYYDTLDASRGAPPSRDRGSLWGTD